MAEEKDDYELLVAGDQQATRDFDRVVLTLATGALALSLVFVHDIAPKPTSTALLVWAWALFAASLLASLTSMLTSHHGYRADIRRLNEDRTDLTLWTKATIGLNWFAAVAVILGVVLLIIFASENI